MNIYTCFHFVVENLDNLSMFGSIEAGTESTNEVINHEDGTTTTYSTHGKLIIKDSTNECLITQFANSENANKAYYIVSIMDAPADFRDAVNDYMGDTVFYVLDGEYETFKTNEDEFKLDLDESITYILDEIKSDNI